MTTYTNILAPFAICGFLMVLVAAQCDLRPGDPSLSACSGSPMYRFNPQRSGRSPFAGPGATAPKLYSTATVGIPLVGPSYFGQSNPDLETAPIFVESNCTNAVDCPGYLVVERPFNSSGEIAAAFIAPEQVYASSSPLSQPRNHQQLLRGLREIWPLSLC